MRKIQVFCFALLLGGMHAKAQYTVNGSATRDNCHCYTLTQNVLTQSGSVWNNNRIDLSQSFNYVFDVFLGCSDGGADGIAFVLQPISTSVGGNGSGMGFGGISPSVGVTLDTYQNSSPDNDPFYDHIAIQLNGDVNHNSPNTLTPLTPISATNNNVEDCAVHKLRIIWDAPTTTLSVLFDNQPRVSSTRDLVNTVFSGNSMVFWGFTGATGGLSNLQQFCTTLVPGFNLLPDQKRCVNEPITFYDNTISFGGILKRYWNFGDGSPIDSVNTNPVHTYTTAGDYTVTISVIAVDSCVETMQQTVRVGSKPIASFSINDSCVNNQVTFNSSPSSASVGNINAWYWDLANSATATTSNTTTSYSTGGTKVIKLVVTTDLGCSSDTLYRPIQIYARPQTGFTFTDSVCLGTPTNFFGNIVSSSHPVTTYGWNFGDTSTFIRATQNSSYTFSTAGTHTVTFMASSTGSAGCMGTTTKSVFVTTKPVAATRVVKGCQDQIVQLLDSSYTFDGLPITGWWWNLGNGNFSTLQNPFATYTTPGTIHIQLVATNSRGCRSDTLNTSITIAAKPVAKFGYSSPLCEAVPIQLSDSSTIAGSIVQWHWTENSTLLDSIANPLHVLFPGLHTIGLMVTNASGCVSDFFAKDLLVQYRPSIKWSFSDACKNAPVLFNASDSLPGSVASWHWTLGNLQQSGNPVTHIFNSNGTYPISLYGSVGNGCPNTDTLHGNLIIYGTNAFAGNDIVAAAMQSVQLQASGGLSYEWTPSFGLSASSIPNPVATVGSDMTYYLKAFTPEGCESYDTLNIKIYKGPDIYLPNAFTPNNDGLNDVFRGIPVGIKTFHFLKVYNRWGQMIFFSEDPNYGWDGKWKSKAQEQGVYVVMASGIDFTGKLITKKSTVMLLK